MMLLILLCTGIISKASAQDAPAREMRSAWVATVWRLDWPQTLISSTGNETQINKQKQQMTQLLDSLSLNNFNAINFQVRSRCDAMYRSSYEPWSSDLVDERGMDPGWDPLEWTVQECHKRGLECHAWLNPYRYESVAGQWDGTPNAYRAEHPDWIMDVTASNGTTASILNPGRPEVTQRICDIIAEIITNYDVDGVLFDDYFYLSGTKTSHDGDLYDAYKANGGTLSINDWRRDNVNRMIGAVYTTIKSIKPWVRFGVSPAGIACTNQSVADQYGIPRCPTGSDWQYSDIFSDPIAWVSQQNLDFISPQIYWTIGNNTDYKKAAQWWSMVAHRWNRHMYVSHSISELTGSSKAPGMSMLENTVMAQDPEYASGPNSGTFAEYVRQINLNREYNEDDAPGSIFYSAKYLYRTAPLFSHYLRNNAFQTHCLLPAMTWMPCELPGLPQNVTMNGSKVIWTAENNMRYSVYAFPEGTSVQQMVRDPKYLLGVSYSDQFTLPSKYLSGYKVAVATLDRYGNESGLALPGQPTGNMAAPVLTYPAANSSVEAPFTFSWENVVEASEFVVEIATDAAMSNRIDQRSTTATEIASDKFIPLPLGEKLYWRVRACGAGCADGISAVNEFTVSQLTISTPADGGAEVSLTPTFTYTISDREVNLEIAKTDKFEDADIIYTHTHTSTHTVARYTLSGGTQYFARARYQRNGETLYTPVINFTTAYSDAVIPGIAVPVANGELYSNQHLTVTPVDGPTSITVELAADATFPVRSKYISKKVDLTTMEDPKTAGEIRLSSKALVDGQTYYVRACATYAREDGNITTEYSPAVQCVYRAGESGINGVNAAAAALSYAEGILTAARTVNGVSVMDAAGRTVMNIGAMEAGQSVNINLTAGVYFIVSDTETLKVIL